jgi:hypothetical protein
MLGPGASARVQEEDVRRITILIAGVMLAVSACAAGDGGAGTDVPESLDPAESQPEATTAASDEPAPSTAASSSPAVPVGEAGSFTVNGTEFVVTLLNRCIPFQDEPGNVDLQPIAQGAQLNLVRLGDFVDVSVQGSQIEAMFGSIAFGEDDVVQESNLTEDRWTGAASVGDSLGSGETVDITWDVMVPPEAEDCSL